jgi:antitoxin (DNA-binding transcriptional repressor) of toxin-antitoxin stability system
VQTAAIEDLQIRLPDLLEKLSQGNEVLITCDGVPVAKLVQPQREKPRPQFGSAKGTLAHYVDDDEHLQDFEEYMP